MNEFVHATAVEAPGTLEQVRERMDACNGNLHSAAATLQGILDRLQGPAPTEAGVKGQDHGPGLFGSLTGTVEETEAAVQRLLSTANQLDQVVR